MWTADGPQVLEFNARFGDPETQALMPRVQGDFARLLKSAADGALEADAATFSRDACVCVTLATPDYPRASTPIRGFPAVLELPDGAVAFWGTSKRNGERIDAAGGRVLTVAATGGHLGEARARAYDAVARLGAQLAPIEKLSYRSDIAKGA
jgi:phosphoribosylamine--glycine ligase